MGTADIIPGVSGGTIAFITGIYPRLIGSLSGVDLSFIPLLFRRKFRQSYNCVKKIDFQLFLPLGFGILLAMWLLSGIITLLLKEYPAYTYSFFFGLILASAFLIFRKSQKRGKFKYENLIFLLLGLVFAYVITGISSLQVGQSFLMTFFSGAAAICAMILPGISGAFILLLLNQYEHLLGAIHSLNLWFLCTFALGAATGLAAFSKALEYLLRKFRQLTLSFLIGLMVGSLRIPLGRMAGTQSNILFIILFAGIGLILVIVLEAGFRRSEV